MKRLVIGSLVGGIILFAWNMVSWWMLPVHTHTFRYSPAQDSVLHALTQLGEGGVYMLPSADNRGVSGFDADFRARQEAAMKNAMGHPTAVVFYSASMEDANPLAFVGTILAEVVAALLAAVLLVAARERITTFFQRWWLVMLIPVIVLLVEQLPAMTFMAVPWHYESGFVYDSFMAWALGGAWLAWWFRR